MSKRNKKLKYKKIEKKEVAPESDNEPKHYTLTVHDSGSKSKSNLGGK